MSWDSYVAMMLNTLDPETNQYTVTGVGSHGAIYGKDGSKWGSSEGFELYAYEYEIDTGEDTVQKEDINEVEIVKGIFEGKTKGGKAGIRMANKKYMYVNSYDGIHKLSCGGGGALLAQTGDCYLIATWDINAKDSNGQTQCPGDLEKNVIYLREYLLNYEQSQKA
mmetsp:Transcript_24753/g.28442  ORF Transcript_24753/g.28442 Transcript_24753/m.28442 type:complete len:166 (-) Transcript_24753:67-564(-)